MEAPSVKRLPVGSSCGWPATLMRMRPREDLDGDGAVGVVLVHARAGLHGDEQDAEVVFLEKHLREVTGGPGLLLRGFGDFAVQVKLRKLVDHGAVVE